ncbi:hypothetical protein OH76DRAFT_1389802 [Lentinus brumalis]|uniref:PHD-type domain-containing protein n=1 Tax=Lentinus brumalis TaxID=2498619 RepID=A0A371CUM8_9APHY|nr:hypothetical protein OH76DRAFT_1389802 [Polyporus brumalis]
MPRRTATPATPAPPAPLPPPPRDLLALAQSDPQWAHNLHALRRNWKWANFSQFFYTFAPLLNMPDVFLSDIEDDLARGTNVYLPRIMYRLLYTLSQDRKLSIDNWQSALRRQYLRRDPAANPIGPEPEVLSRESSLAPSEEEQEEEEAKEDVNMDESKQEEGPHSDEKQSGEPSAENAQGESASEPKTEPVEDGKVPATDKDDEPSKTEDEPQEESRDWLDLPMLDKLDSLHLLTEWQFQNPHRVRQIMKDDDDAANWRIEPIGYDAKTNAYWLIGPDRLWIQRVPPKSPRNRNLKRKRPSAPPKKPARKAPETSSDEEEDEPVAPSKRTRTQTNSRSTRSQPQAKANGRSTRGSRRAAVSSDELVSPGKSTRAAKVQANKKLDLQAKELAEFQRQAAALARAQTSPRKARGAAASPGKRDRAVGTRVSARLRGSARGGGGEEESDEEWQQVPEEWLQDAAPARRTRTRTRSKGKARAEPEEEDEEPEEEPEVEEEQPDAEEEQLADEDEADAEKGGDDFKSAGDANTDDLLQKAGLESGSVSDLTDLSDAEEAEADAAEESEPADAPPAKRQRGSGRRGRGGRRKSAASTRTRARRGRAAAEAPSTTAKQSSPAKAKAQSKSNSQPSNSKSKSEADGEPEPEEDQEMEEPERPLPEGFVEWEAIAVTLSEWEHVADPFEKATHYLEKALYKMLTQNIVPLVTADLREAERRRRKEEAIVHRKRSSRIAIKETEKEEAMRAAKMRAEEEERNSRARRMEARQRKEEEERAKREKAREQRAKEREEREARAKAKAERAEREDAGPEAGRSTATSVNGTQQSSLQPSRMVTPNGVRTPDWVLDCEVCHKQGVNVDDGMAMVSCGSCNRWQHIKCHDIADQRAGRPRRDWEKQQFYCMRCRQRAMNGGAYGAQSQSVHQQQQSYGWQPRTGGPVHLHKPGGMDPYAQTSDMRYSHSHSQSHRSPVMENRGGMAYPQQQQPQQYLANNVGATSYSRSSYPNSGVSFHTYQPDQRGLSRGVPSTPQGSWSSNGGGYGGAADPLAGRMPSSQYAAAYNGSSMYGGSRMPVAYQNHPSPPIPQYTNDHGVGSMSTSRWPPSSSHSNGYHSPAAVQEAAQSLAFMHDGAGGSASRYGNTSWPAQTQTSSYGQIPASSSQPASHHSHAAYAPPPPGIDPLTGQPFAHVGHGLTHSGGSGSFNFPS